MVMYLNGGLKTGLKKSLLMVQNIWHSNGLQIHMTLWLLQLLRDHYIGELCTWFDKLDFFLLFLFIEKLYSPACSTVPASLQALGHRLMDFNKV